MRFVQFAERTQPSTLAMPTVTALSVPRPLHESQAVLQINEHPDAAGVREGVAMHGHTQARRELHMHRVIGERHGVIAGPRLLTRLVVVTREGIAAGSHGHQQHVAQLRNAGTAGARY